MQLLRDCPANNAMFVPGAAQVDCDWPVEVQVFCAFAKMCVPDADVLIHMVVVRVFLL